LTAKLYLGRSQALLGDCDKALELMNEVAQKEPRNPEAQAGLGYCFFQLERFVDSAAAYRNALQYGPEEPNLLNALGQSELRAGNRNRATEAFSRSLEIDPEQAEVQAVLQEIRSNSEKIPQ
jgi:Flp pilus assembly protein TadD